MTWRAKSVPSLRGYWATSDGKIISSRKSRTGESLIEIPGYIGDSGYVKLTLADNAGKQIHRNAHALVAEAWHGARPEGMQVRHLDGDGSNNHPGNLRYGTAQENSDDIGRHGRRGGGRKVKDDDVRSIRRLGSEGMTNREIAVRFGIAPLTVYNIIRGRRRANVT